MLEKYKKLTGLIRILRKDRRGSSGGQQRKEERLPQSKKRKEELVPFFHFLIK